MNKTVAFPVSWFRQEYPLHPTEVFIKKYDLTSYFNEKQIGEFVSQFESLITEECIVNILREYTRVLMGLISVKNFKYISYDETEQTVSVEVNIDELAVLCKDQMNETDRRETLSEELWNAYVGQVFCSKEYAMLLKAAIDNCEFTLFQNNAKFNELVKSIKDTMMQQEVADIRDKKTIQSVEFS